MGCSHLHLHVISDDLVSLSLKNKKHYNSFRPDLGFFVPLREVQSWVEAGADCAVHVEVGDMDVARSIEGRDDD